jgi:hypothetical protein
MLGNSSKKQSSANLTEQEFVRLQFEQAMESYRWIFSLLAQLTAVLIIADATVVGYSISTQISGILLIGPLFPLMILYLGHMASKMIVPIVYTAVSLENNYGAPNVDFLASTSFRLSCLLNILMN